MKAKALNKPTPVNLINHAYWNLGNHNSGNILGEVVQIFGSRITVLDSHLIPTGEIASVKGTPYDFLSHKLLGPGSTSCQKLMAMTSIMCLMVEKAKD